MSPYMVLCDLQVLTRVVKRRYSFIGGFDEKTPTTRRNAMKIEVSVLEEVTVFKEIQKHPREIFEMIRFD